ncbi:hypothetical protein LINPERHAP2_LOCUS18496, partial [Linum perenne]
HRRSKLKPSISSSQTPKTNPFSELSFHSPKSCNLLVENWQNRSAGTGNR